MPRALDFGARLYYLRDGITPIVSFGGVITVPQATEIEDSYTVPAGKRALICFARIAVRVVSPGAATNQGTCSINLTPDGAAEFILMDVVEFGNSNLNPISAVFGGNVVLFPGDLVTIKTSAVGASGSYVMNANLILFEYDF